MALEIWPKIGLSGKIRLIASYLPFLILGLDIRSWSSSNCL